MGLLIIECSSNIKADAEDRQGIMESNMDEVISVSNSSVRYYGMMVKTPRGLRGRVIINDVEVEKFDVSGSQISSNQPQCFLRVGVNTLKIDLDHLETIAVKHDDGVPIKIDFHAMDEPDFPDESNLFFTINWSPEKAAEKTYRFVLANNQKPVRTAICD